MKTTKEKKMFIEKKSLTTGIAIGSCIAIWSLIIIKWMGYI